MSYQVIARKWRPQSFKDLVGQEHVVTTLENALKQSRMPHALLFTGARGVGKTSAARILAKSLRCPNTKDLVPCNECSDCTEIANGTSVNVIEIDGASNNGVESIRELRETVAYMPSHGKYKVYIIDEVHMLSTSAFNALLKTLEEPPAHVVFIFATTEIQKIPVTILSRCQRFDFKRIATRKVVERLKFISEAEGVKMDTQSLWLLARESEGSLRDSQSLLDQVITFCGSEVTYKKVVEILGLTDRSILFDTLKAIIERQPQRVLAIIQKVVELGYEPKQFVQDLLKDLRNMMIVKVSQGLSLDFLDLPDEELKDFQAMSDGLTNEDIHLLFDMSLKGAGDVMRSQDSRTVLEMLLIRLTQAPSLESIEKFLYEGGGSSSPGVTRKMTVTAKADPTWKGFVDKLKSDRPLLGAKLEYAALDQKGDRWNLIFKKEQGFLFNQVNSPETLGQLSQLAGQYFGKAVVMSAELVTASGSVSPKEEVDLAKADKTKKMKDNVEAHPLVRELKSTLDAKITAIRDLSD